MAEPLPTVGELTSPTLVEISLLTDADVLAALAAHRCCFADEHIHKAFFGHLDYTTSVRVANERYFRGLAADNAARRGRSIALKAERGGKLIGFAVWVRPKREGEVDAESEPTLWPPGCDLEAVEGYFGRFDLGVQEPHWCECLERSPRESLSC